jgi:hypothetical protein
MSDYEREVGMGFNVFCEMIGSALNWSFYIILFPICYPLALLGRTEKARILRENEESRYSQR